MYDDLHERIITQDGNGDPRDVLVRMQRLTSFHYYAYRVTVFDRDLQQIIQEHGFRTRDAAFKAYESYELKN